jgi:LPS O-antigen subunit length determinant protein (WzzB/FepE family)
VLGLAGGRAHADEPEAAPAPTQTSAPPAGADVPAKPVAASAPVAKEAAAASMTPEQLDKFLRAKGYTPRMIDGKKYYCRGDDVLGTRLQHAQQCAPADQLSIQQRQARQGVEEFQRTSAPRLKDGGKP